MPSSTSTTDEPQIIIRAKESPCELSLTSPRKGPLIVTLLLTLIGSSKPLSLWIPHSFLCTQGADTSNYRLKQEKTGQFLPSSKYDLVTEPRFQIDPDTELLTLYPETETPWTVQIGVDDMYISGTLITMLTAVRWYDLVFGPRVWWWSFGDQKSIIRQQVPIWKRLFKTRKFVASRMSTETEFSVQMLNYPQLQVVR